MFKSAQIRPVIGADFRVLKPTATDRNVYGGVEVMVWSSDRLTVFTRRVLLALLLLTSGGTNSRADELDNRTVSSAGSPCCCRTTGFAGCTTFHCFRIPDVPVVNTVAEWNEYAAATRAAAARSSRVSRKSSGMEAGTDKS
ncbi:MAG: hypothetical protein R3C17_16025 [Planctomycetaceae bacterium]